MKFIIPFCLLTVISFNADSQQLTEKTMKNMVNDICECIMPKVNKLHPRLIRMMESIVAKGQAEAEKELTAWMETASEEEIQKVLKDSEYLENEFQDEMDKCDEMMDKKYKNGEAKELTNVNNKKLMKMIEEKNGCKLLAGMIKWSLKEEAKDQ